MDSVWQDIRYAVRTLRRAPLYALTVAATMGLGLGLLGSAFTLINAYLFKPVDLPDPRALHALSWSTGSTLREQMQRQRAEEEEVGRHLRLEIETLRAPKRIEKLAVDRLRLVAPGPGQAVVIERAVPSEPPDRTVVASR